MRIMVFAKATEDREKGVPLTAEAFAAMDRFTEKLVKAGIFVAAAGLKNTAEANRIETGPPLIGHRQSGAQAVSSLTSAQRRLKLF